MYQKLIQKLSIGVAVLLFFVEVVPFFTGHDNLPALIEAMSSTEVAAVEEEKSLPSSPTVASTTSDCGQYWTSWTTSNRNFKDPCPKGCQKTELLETSNGSASKLKYKFQCIKS